MTATVERAPERTSGVPVPDGRPPRRRPAPGPWLMSGAVALAVCLAAASLNGVLEGWSWLPHVVLAVAAVELGTAAGRALRWPAAVGFLLGLAGLVASLTAMFLAPASLLGVVPGPGTARLLEPMLAEAQDTVVSQVAPVLVNPGIVLLACAGIGVSALLLDTIAVPLQMPATSGAVLLAVVSVPAVIKPGSIGPWGFAAAAAGYLLVLGCAHWYHGQPATLDPVDGSGSSGPAGRRAHPVAGQFGRAAAVGAAGIAAALVLPPAVPGFHDGLFPEGSRLTWLGVPTGLNPVVSLGENLRRPGAFGRMTYATDAPTGLYLRSVTLENLTGARWRPSDTRGSRRTGVESIDLPRIQALLADGTVTTTEISTSSFTSPWLLAPYAPARIEGLEGTWTWDPRTLNIRGTAGTTTAGQEYTVTSVAPKLSRALLASAAPADVQAVDEVFSELPADMPRIIKDTTEQVAGDLDRPFEQALAIQRYLRGPDFTYSEQAPVDGGYDQSGFGVVGAFLEAKAGYCVHFSAAMAIMAREAGIPSRIAVGYAPGRRTGGVLVRGGRELTQYEVDSRDAHAWPELYFDDIGWVAFEPTPGRGVVPDYAQANAGPAPGQAPEDNLVPGGPAPSAPDTAPEAPGAAPGSAGRDPEQPLWAAALGGCMLLVLLAPLLLRTGRRRRRRTELLSAGMPGARAALVAWAETLDDAADYGQPAGAAESAREFAARLGASGALAGPAVPALGRLRAAYERAAYADPGQPAGGPEAAAGKMLLDDTGQVRAGLRAAAGWRQRLAARFLPRSLFRRR
ncbi:transglutaminaseTgpA domain-containing protein [Arthrobacter mobilis]|uniref:Transglutaminase n=1 Tax=Arthrobacter mobilis TaxID=2724944 RepID=A0A7X6K5C6_9MICC|nr:transglutaminaseTgpA domain-containing protein [Arthrobacter mobilis]NKX53288.1 transglutaminase [Arthrobacter mobilis]